MAGNYARVYVHLIWKTWDKLPLLQDDTVGIAYKVIMSKAAVNKCDLLAIGGVEDHVHVLVRLHPTCAFAQLAREMKSGSSHEVNLARPGQFFKWQGSYAAVSVSESAVPDVTKYIENQADHHRRGYLRDELETVEEFDD